MKILRGIERPISGERVLATLPPLSPYVTAAANQPAPRKRLDFFTGRALSHLALTDEQRNRMRDAGRLALAVAPGVIDGFEVVLEGPRLLIMPGHALSGAGEDIELHYPLRVEADVVPVENASIVARLAPAGDAADDALRARLAQGEQFTLGTLRDLGRLDLLPHAMVLVARPVTIAIDSSGELDSPCPNAVGEGAYSELAWEDGLRLEWVPWPNDTSLPPWTADGTTIDRAFRNRLAYRIFNGERERVEIDDRLRRLRLARSVEQDSTRVAAIDAELTSLAARPREWPWEPIGVALTVIGFDADMLPAFADRNAVVRQGGGRVNRATLVGSAGEDTLWLARFSQLIEQLAEVPAEQRQADEIAKLFDWLPPAGVLPKETVDIAANRQFLFPASFDVQAQPIPIDMVDALIAESAPLSPYNLSVDDQVQILVPVPARFFDPDLLRLDERINPLFDAEILRLTQARESTLTQRDRLRRRFDALSHAIIGRLPTYPEDDPAALPDETGALDAMAFARIRRTEFAAGETVVHAFRNAQFKLELGASDVLFVFVRPGAASRAVSLQAFVGAEAKTLVFWGEAADAPAGAVVAGALPSDDAWCRLTVTVAAAGLSATRIDGLAFGVIGGPAAGEMQWGYAGKLANGFESYWVADALPQGADTQGLGVWNWQEQGDPSADGEGVADAVNGIALVEDSRHATELDMLIDAYTAYRGGVLKGELGVPTVTTNAAGAEEVTPAANPPLADVGLDALIARVDTRIAAANDHVEFGFLRARTDIYRVRQSVLGIGSAGRLLTSPAAAELITRSDNPVATEKDFADYFQRASEPPSAPAPAGPAAAPPIAPAAAAPAAPPPAAPLPAAPVAPSAPTLSPVLRSSSIAAALTLHTSSSASILRGSTLGTLVAAPAPIAASTVAAGAGVTAPAVAAGPTLPASSIPVPTASAGALAGRAVVLPAESGLAATAVAKLAAPSGPTLKEVTGTSLFGATLNTVTVGERLTGSAAVVAKNAAASGKSDFVKTGVALLADQGLAIDDLPVFGYKLKDGVAGDVTAKSLNDDKLEDTDSEDVTGSDVAESVYFQRGLDAIDNMVRFLRGVELRVEDYKRLRADADAARTRILDALGRVDGLIAALATKLAETRHDLAVARALRAEEVQRVAAIVARRKAILAEQVPYVVFRRPRLAKTLLDVPVRSVEPAVIEDPVPRCREDTHDVPPELQAMVDTLKDVPAAWIRRLQPLVLKFDRIDTLQTLVGAAAQRIAAAPSQPSKLTLSNGAQTKTGMLIASAFSRQTQRVALAVSKQAQSLSRMKTDTWKNAVQSAVHGIAATDLIKSAAADKHITLEASGELDDIAGVSSCLYYAFCGVPPATRLLWAERFSQSDPDVSLRVLTVLPGFGDERLGVDYITWKQMQRMVDWLFSRVSDDADAISAINDLVQVALLLSAHAPVKRIISARVRKPVKPVVDGRLDLEIDPKIARIGMQVLVHAPIGNTPVARAVVEDLVPDGVVAKIAEVVQPAVTIHSGMRVQLQSGPPLSTAATAARDAARAVSLNLFK